MNGRWKVILAFVGVFLAGVVCSEPLTRWLLVHRQENRPAFAERTMRRFEHELRLTDAQKAKIAPILERTQDEWRRLRAENVRSLTAVIDRMHAEIAAELSAEQRARLEGMTREFRARAERLRGRPPRDAHDGGPSHPM
jgi:Spy/CpxP family protein refolding chaperone